MYLIGPLDYCNNDVLLFYVYKRHNKGKASGLVG